jgi:IS30 family transposase
MTPTFPRFGASRKARTIHAEDLAVIAESLNNRPRKTLGYLKPSEKLAELLATTP